MQQLTMQDIDYIIGLYHQTNSRKQVARELGLSEYRVRRILIDNGILSDYDAAIAAAAVLLAHIVNTFSSSRRFASQTSFAFRMTRCISSFASSISSQMTENASGMELNVSPCSFCARRSSENTTVTISSCNSFTTNITPY